MGIIETNIKKAFIDFEKTGNLYCLVKKLLCDSDYSVRFAWQFSDVLDNLKKYCPKDSFECIWYNGEFGQYELLEFNPNGLSIKKIKIKAWKILKRLYMFDEDSKDKVLESLYLLPTTTLIKLGD